MAYRSREEIFASILSTAGSGAGITRSKIMFGSYLTYAQVVEYSKLLIERGLLEYDPINRTFKTTSSVTQNYYDLVLYVGILAYKY